jgi:adenylate cyclase
MTIPSAVRATVLGRLRQMTARERDVLNCAAVIGPRFDLPVLAAAVTHSQDEVRANIQAACRLDLVVAEATHERYAFRHALTREIIYAEALAARMRPMHRRIVRALEGIDSPSEASLPQLAYHALAARDPRRALRYYERLGDAAAVLDAPQDAATCFARARSLLHVESPDYVRLTEKLRAVAERVERAP